MAIVCPVPFAAEAAVSPYADWIWDGTYPLSVEVPPSRCTLLVVRISALQPICPADAAAQPALTVMCVVAGFGLAVDADACVAASAGTAVAATSVETAIRRRASLMDTHPPVGGTQARAARATQRMQEEPD